MKKSFKKAGILLLCCCMFISMLAGCSGKKSEQNDDKTTTDDKTTSDSKPLVEWWFVNETGKETPKDGKTAQFMSEKAGVGYWSPSVLWDGGNGYQSKLQLRIASDEMPDMFTPIKGNEVTLAKDGKIVDLKEYLPKYAPNIWNAVPQDVWDTIAASDPTGNGGIYYVPSVFTYYDYGPFIRKDWLDKLGLSMPTTQQEYVEVLKQFRDGDPNGNGLQDELPTSGREFGRWMDHIFAMYGVSMMEGYPQYDMYDGQLTYSALTPNMKAALEFASSLYQDKLLDQDTFLNKANDLWAKINGDKVGSWFHIPRGSKDLVLDKLLLVAPNAELAILPSFSAEGYDGYYSYKKIGEPQLCITKNDEETIINCLKLADWYYNPDNMDDIIWGVPDVSFTMENGNKVPIPRDQQIEALTPFANLTLDYQTKMLQAKADVSSDVDKKTFETVISLLNDSQGINAKQIASDGMPNSVYEGYPDIQSHKLYQEYMTKIILGTYSIDKFDEFVEMWNQSGGDEVTKRARDWYAKLEK